MKLFLQLLPIVIFITYVSGILIFYGIQRSISDSYYRLLPGKKKYLFTFFCWGFAYPILMLHPTPLMYAATTFIMVVGASPAFKQDKIVKWSHMIGAYGGVLFGMLSIWLDFGLWYISILFIITAGTMMLLKVKNQIWYIEIIAFLTIYFVVIFGS